MQVISAFFYDFLEFGFKSENWEVQLIMTEKFCRRMMSKIQMIWSESYGAFAGEEMQMSSLSMFLFTSYTSLKWRKKD